MADEKNLGDQMAIMHIAALAELGIIPPVCPWCEGRGLNPEYIELGVACSWCSGTGNVPSYTHEQKP